jgi:uncharacterized lipoprotein YajG
MRALFLLAAALALAACVTAKPRQDATVTLPQIHAVSAQ